MNQEDAIIDNNFDVKKKITVSNFVNALRRMIIATFFKACSNDNDKYSGSTMDNFEENHAFYGMLCSRGNH